MRTERSSLEDALGLVLVLAVALALRSNWSYRTAFNDEAINLFGGWQALHGVQTYASTFHMGWYVLSFFPLGLAGWLWGLEAARALNALWGVLTVWVVLLIARRLYGRIAGYIAGGIYAVFAPAIVLSTLATYDSLSLLCTSLAVYVWVRALTENRDRWYWLGSLLMVLAVLAKYPAALVAVLCVAYGIFLALRAMLVLQREGAEVTAIRINRTILRRLVLAGLPFALLLLYGFIYWRDLAQLWRYQVLSKQSVAASVRLDILELFARYLWLPALLAPLALLERKHRAIGVGLGIIGLSMLSYHLLNRDQMTLYKHTCYMLIGLAPLAAGGIVNLMRWVAKRLGNMNSSIPSIVVGLATVAYLGTVAQLRLLPGLRSYWADTSELMQYLSTQIREGDRILMEAGWVGKYYLIERGTAGHIPARIADTWYYQDEQGAGTPAYRRAVEQKRFDWIIFDYLSTSGLDEELLPLMQGHYALQNSFSARVYGQWGQIDVYRVVQ